MAQKRKNTEGQQEVDMIYSQGKIIHQNLSAEYTDVPKLLNSMSEKGFSGVIEVEAGSRRGAFFIVSGRIVNAAVGLESNPPAMVGEPAVNELHQLARQPKGLLHVSELSPAQIEILTGPFASELVFKGLSTDFIRVEGFIAKLKSEGHTGYTEVFSKDGGRIGTLSFKDGETTVFQMVSTSGKTNLYEGDFILSALDYTVRNGAVFDVYRTRDMSTVVVESQENAQREMSFPAAFSASARSEPEPPAEAVVEAATVEAPDEKQETSADKLAERLAKMQEAAGAASEAASGVVEDEASKSHRAGLISGLERVLSKLESFTDHVGSKGEFQRVFRQKCVDISDNYDFLDPFEGQFQYDSGKISLSEDVSSEDFAIGAAHCLNVVLAKLNTDFLKGAALPPGLKGEIETSFRDYKEIIRVAGLGSIVPANMR